MSHQLTAFLALDDDTRAMLLELAGMKDTHYNNTGYKNYNKAYDSGITASPVQILLATCKTLSINPASLRSASRERKFVEARSIAIYLLRSNKKQCKGIGRLFNRTHATAVYSCEQHIDLVKTNSNYRKKYDAVLAALNHKEVTNETR